MEKSNESLFDLSPADTASCQRIAKRSEELETTRRTVAEMKAGKGRPAAQMLDEMQKVIEGKRGR